GQQFRFLTGPAREARGQLRPQLLVERGAVGAQRGARHLQPELGRRQFLRRQLEEQLLGVDEGQVHVRRQRVVTGQEQVEGTEQVERVVLVGDLPQQRHRWLLGRGSGARGRRLRLRAAGDERGGRG